MRRFGFLAILALVALPVPASAVELAGSGNIEVVSASACTALAVSTTDATVTLVAGQRYRVWSTTDVFLRVGATAVTTGASMPVAARTPEPMAFARTGATAPVVHGVTAAGTGTVYFCPIVDGR